MGMFTTNTFLISVSLVSMPFSVDHKCKDDNVFFDLHFNCTLQNNALRWLTELPVFYMIVVINRKQLVLLSFMTMFFLICISIVLFENTALSVLHLTI